MSKLVEAAAEFLARDTSTKHNHEEFSEAMHSMSPMKKKMEAMAPMKKKMAKKEMDESFLLSQEEFQSLSEEDREYYVKQLMELKKSTLGSYVKKAAGSLADTNFRMGTPEFDKLKGKDALQTARKTITRQDGIETAARKLAK